MTIKLPLSNAKLLKALKTEYSLEISKLTLLPLGADLNAAIYKARAQDQKDYFVKIKQGHLHEKSAMILSFLCDAGVKELLPPLKTAQGSLTLRVDHWTLVVYPFIEHQNGFSKSLTSDQWRTLGTLLKKVHTLNIPPAIESQLRKETYSSESRDCIRSFYSHLESHPQQKDDIIAKKLLKFIKEHQVEINQLVNTAELLSKQMRLQPARECVLCHSDLHGGNVLIEENGSIYVVDWDEPILAPKERDLMFIGGVLLMSGTFQKKKPIFMRDMENPRLILLP